MHDCDKRQTSSFECFHVTRQLPYSPPVPMTVGQTFEVGTSHNPFFSFYERPRTYWITYNNGDRENVPAIQFLERIKDGVVNHNDLPSVAVEVSKHYMMLARELLYEQVRLNEAPHLPSRQACLWASVSREDANGWMLYLGGTAQVLRLQVEGWSHVADANLLLTDSEPLSETYRKASMYWRGDHSQSPHLELLVSGRVTIIEEIR